MIHDALTELHHITESTPFLVIDMAFHVWLIGHLAHHAIALVPKRHRHIKNAALATYQQMAQARQERNAARTA